MVLGHAQAVCVVIIQALLLGGSHTDTTCPTQTSIKSQVKTITRLYQQLTMSTEVPTLLAKDQQVPHPALPDKLIPTVTKFARQLPKLRFEDPVDGEQYLWPSSIAPNHIQIDSDQVIDPALIVTESIQIIAMVKIFY